MSFAALAWAEQQRAGGGVRKCVLLLVASFANEDGASWYSQAALAERAEVSSDTVARVLREFEAQDLVYRIPRKGRDGRRISDVIVVLHDERARVYAAGHGWRAGAAGKEPGEETRQDQGQDPSQENAIEIDAEKRPDAAPDRPGDGNSVGQKTGTDPHNMNEHPAFRAPAPPSVHTAPSGGIPAGCGGAPRTGAGAIIESSKESYSPQRPPLTLDRQAALTEFEDSLLTFVRAYPPTSEPLAKLRRAWAALSPEERQQAVAGLERYRATLGARKPALARVYLRDRLWDTTAALRRAGVRPASAMVFVRKGSPAFEAWEAHERAAGRRRRIERRVFDALTKEFTLRSDFADPFVVEWREPASGKLLWGYWRATLFPPRAVELAGETETEKEIDA